VTDCTVFICASKSLIPGAISYIKWVETLLVFHFISGPQKENERSRSLSLMTAIDSLLYFWSQKMENTFYRDTVEILGSPGKKPPAPSAQRVWLLPARARRRVRRPKRYTAWICWYKNHGWHGVQERIETGWSVVMFGLKLQKWDQMGHLSLSKWLIIKIHGFCHGF